VSDRSPDGDVLSEPVINRCSLKWPKLGSSGGGIGVVGWPGLSTGTALWALALYLPLSLSLARFEAVLAEGPLPAAMCRPPAWC